MQKKTASFHRECAALNRNINFIRVKLQIIGGNKSVFDTVYNTVHRIFVGRRMQMTVKAFCHIIIFHHFNKIIIVILRQDRGVVSENVNFAVIIS